MVMNALEPMMQFVTPLPPLREMLVSMWDENKCFFQPHSTLFVKKLTLCLPSIHTLIDIVIADPTQTDLLPRSYATQGFVASNVVQAKERSYCNLHPID
jgi:hypothetical protein